MGTEPELSRQTIAILGTLMSRPSDELSGADIAKRTNVASGTLYPILFRLEEVGWLTSRWEAGDPKTLGRPRRRYYKISAEGVRRVAAIRSELTPSSEQLAWQS